MASYSALKDILTEGVYSLVEERRTLKPSAEVYEGILGNLMLRFRDWEIRRHDKEYDKVLAWIKANKIYFRGEWEWRKFLTGLPPIDKDLETKLVALNARYAEPKGPGVEDFKKKEMYQREAAKLWSEWAKKRADYIVGWRDAIEARVTTNPYDPKPWQGPFVPEGE